MPQDEMVLCCRRNELPSGWLPAEGFLQIEERAFYDCLRNITPLWHPRAIAESDPRLKQWIPYTLVQRADGSIASYRRKGSEARLHGFLSVGIGGHINPTDADRSAAGVGIWSSSLRNGLKRELLEEFPGAADGYSRFLGLINEDLSEVGRVHIGAVFLHPCANQNPIGGEELGDLKWVSSAENHQSPNLCEYETWSRLALGLLCHCRPGR